jgi:hypothetical protein
MDGAESLFVHGCIMLRNGAKHGHGCSGSGGLCVADLSFCEDFSVVFSGDVDVVEGSLGEARSFPEWLFIFPFIDCSLFILFAQCFPNFWVYGWRSCGFLLLCFSVHNPRFAFGWFWVEDVETGGASPSCCESAWSFNVPHVVYVVFGVVNYVNSSVAHDVDKLEW